MKEQLSFAWENALQGMDKSLAHANREVSDWSDIAYNYFLEYAKSTSNSFLTEDVVRKFSDDGFPAAPNNCAWGSIALKAKKKGFTEKIGFDYCKLGKGHTKPMTLWKYIGDTNE